MEVVIITAGYLRIEAMDEERNPIDGALVQVYHTDMKEENCIYRTYTNPDGKSEDILLETPDISLSQTPGYQMPYEQYHVEVIQDGFHIEETRNVQVFPEVGSTLPIQMEPAKQGYQKRNVTILEDHSLFKKGRNQDA